MADIIEALLLLSKLRHEQPDMTPLDMGEIMTEVIQRLQDMVQEYNVKITMPNSWLPVSGYRPWVEQVWVNYISNAIKYGGDSPQIELKVTKLSDSMVRFDVQDGGLGISIENQADLFTPFTRLEAGEIEGHGLGLSIVKRIIEKSGGQVGVESAVGEGSTFWFALPLIVEQ
jgi:signal transduction histidine kinase